MPLSGSGSFLVRQQDRPWLGAVSPAVKSPTVREKWLYHYRISELK